MATTVRAARAPGAVAALRRAADVARPVALAGEHLLPVLPPLRSLLPEGGLRRGTVVAVDTAPIRRHGPSSRAPAPSPTGPGGATALALALVAGASAAGSWTALVGAPSVGLLAAAEVGVALERVVVVPEVDAGAWAPVVAALVDAVDVVLVQPGRPARLGDARRLAARARERGSVLVLLPGAGGVAASSAAASWPDGVDVRLTVTAAAWEGIGHGAGHLRARRVEVEAGGRRAAARPHRTALWLPGPGGEIAVVEPVATPVPFAPAARRAG